MLHARLREMRKAKGMTLQEVAERVKPDGTTAQTIGRLETGARTLTLSWLHRIAEAMEVDPAELLSLPESGDIAIGGKVTAAGLVVDGEEGVLAMRMVARDPLAVRIARSMGQYQEGDVVVCEPLLPEDFHRAAGCDCLVEDRDGQRHFGKVVPGPAADIVSLAPLAPSGAMRFNIGIVMAAPAIALMRALAR